MYDYVIVGSGFFGATFARIATDHGKTCVVID
jgi:UDP-galactopyranose mutase